MKYKFKTQPFKHQKVALYKTLTQKHTALLLDPGLGKTKIAIDNLGARYLRDGLKKVIILAPKVVLGVWEDEFNTHLPDTIPYKTYRVRGQRKEKLQIIDDAIRESTKKGLHVILISYDSASEIRRGNNDKKDQEYMNRLLEFNADAVICDESQMIKSNTSARSKAAYKLAKKSDHRLIMTGTMITRCRMDVFGQYRFLDDQIFGTNFFKFRNKFAIMGGYYNKNIIGYKESELFLEAVHQCAVRIREEECLEIPERAAPQVIPVDIEKKTRDIYDTMKKEGIVTLNGFPYVADIPLVKALRLQQIAGGFITAENKLEGKRITYPIGTEKLDATVELTELKVEQGEKIVIYAYYVWELKQLMMRLKKHKPLLIYGGTSETAADDAKYKFQNDPDYPIMIMQISKGIGITLHAARYCIFHSLSKKYDDYYQALKRIHRLGQKRRVFTYVMLARDTIDYHMWQATLLKQDLSEYVQNYKYEIFN